ncbi:Putative non-ribosomal peptide synthase [Alloalcanivorax dieselolei B5]|uniref:Putative non-ribosomal peptide synthase n=1 Tax=Alcanivorax dieselolei (strain DSM 16502 / CGMCC 1.3690 / MCCC 1A00001 / B-5) TaxID=930169 RepID=K0CGS0_ALCDB|nr:non-ribosomal peptide synthetase [Alloalcanivorax dieselolei]AFT70786.1 Putative non-ribosomal peptide synthase [Alloalcanivorax dieselolei B5]GGJ97745.1 non-ribosomal peptide synthetase [Alloalcanivorax dieselolei]
MDDVTDVPDVRARVAAVLELPVASVSDDGNLIEMGIDSITMMRLASEWRRQGHDISFARMVSNPRLSAWCTLLGADVGTDEAETSPPETMSRHLDEQAPFELAPMQHAYWVGRSGDQQLGGVAAHFYNEFDGTGVDADRLERAVKALIERHGMLRVRLTDDGRQCIATDSVWPGLKVHDLRAMPVEDAEQALERLRQSLSHRHMDLAAGEVFDVQLSLLPDAVRANGTRIHFNLDMVAADALSLRVLLQDLACLYRGDALPPIGYSYPRYRADHDAAMAGEGRRARWHRDRDYWRDRLADLPAAPRLPIAGGGRAQQATRVIRRHGWLPPERVAAFTTTARAHGLTPAMALAAVFAEVLTAWSAEPDFLINLPLFNREPLHADVDLLVGDFTSSVLLAWQGSVPGTFVERATALQDRFHADVQHGTFAGVDVLRELSRHHGEQRLAPVVYTSALGLGALFSDTVQTCLGRPSWIISQGPQVWLDAQVTELDDGLLVNMDAREDAFEPGVLDALFEVHERLLSALIDCPDAWCRPVPALLPDSALARRASINGVSRPLSGRRLHEGFFHVADTNPDAPALLWEERETLSYGELRRRAMNVAGYLVGEGVQPDDVVAVSLPKGPEQIIAVLGVLAAGAAYLPIGVDQPEARRRRILGASGARLTLEALPEASAPLSVPVPGSERDLAYILYTSGSTGEPKGVEVPHRAAMNTIEDLIDRLDLCGEDRILALSALEFDLSVFDMFAALSVGAAVVCVTEKERRDAMAWHCLMRCHRVTVLNCVPALLDMILSAADAETPMTLRAVLLGGDRIPPELPGRLARQAPDCRFIALGGTTETAIHSTFFEVKETRPRWHSAPYGTPLANVRLRVVDALGRDCPDFVAGELWIGGEGVARGYRGDPRKTASRFVERDGVRWYRTGDQARYRPDGNVEFLGRLDHQIKVRGHRIELGEVEAALAGAPGVGQAAAVVGKPGLVAVVTLAAAPRDRDQAWVDLRALPAVFESLRDHLAATLPSVMIPVRFYGCAALPLTANGKIDRKTLARRVEEQERRREPAAVMQPEGEVERRVAEVWCRLLELPRVGRDQNFFSLGGDSLLATRMIRRLSEEGLTGVRLAALFEKPVLSAFAATLELGDGPVSRRQWHADIENRYQPFPPTEVQRAYWIGRDPGLPLGGVSCHFYREYDVEDLDVARLQDALNRLIDRHEMLRAVFDDQGHQRILPDVARFSIPVEEVEGDWDAACERLREEAAHRVFDPTLWPLFDIRAVRSGTRTRLAISLDNLILDALSILMFYQELDLLYREPHTELPPVSLSFRDYRLNSAPTEQERDQARAFWLKQLPQLPPAPQLPLARRPEDIDRPRFVRHQGTLDADTWSRLTARAQNEGVTPSALLLTAFAEVLGRWSAQPRLTLNLTLFDRQEVHPDIHRVMGDFTSLTLLGYRPEPGDSWLERLRRTQTALGEALDHRAWSSVTLLRELARDSGEGLASMPVVFTSALGVPGGTAAPQEGPFRRQVWGLTQTPQVWIDHQVVEADGGIALNWDVVEALFPDGLITDMFQAYMRLLDELAGMDWRAPVPDVMPVSQRAVRDQINDTRAPLPSDTLHQAFFQHARDHGERVALYWGQNGTRSHGELADHALRIAARLQRAGVSPGGVVAVQLPKGPDQIAAVLGVLAAGAAYLPLGMEQPPARRDRVLKRAAVRWVVTASEYNWPESVTPCFLEDARSMAPLSGPLPVDADQLAYVIFTSGSTGEPKGVEITHRAALNTVLDINRRFDVGPDDRVLAVSALDFDLSVYDIFGLLGAGGALILVDEQGRREARDWHALMRRYGATIWNSAPALLEMLMAVSDPAEPPGSLRLALASGDWIALDLPARVAECCPGCRFVALGGATEASIWSNFYPLQELAPDWCSIPYGWPLTNQRFRVVDGEGRDCPDWVAGELWIGGDGLALGYRADPERSADRFVRVETGEARRDGRWYRTGDRARYRPGGLLEFLGRIDGQVKIRGHRIELGEVEAALAAFAGVERAVALLRRGPASAMKLVAAVVAPGEHPDAERLRSHLAGLLPPPMIPERIDVLAALPLTANGKVDRAALAAHFAQSGDEAEQTGPPRGEWETRVAELWAELLEINAPQRQHSFFELGGDSLLATRFSEIVRRRHGVALSLRHLFAHPVLADVASALQAESARTADMEEGAL